MRQHLMSERYYSRYYSLEQHIKPADRHHHHDGGAIVPTNATDTCLYNVPSPILQFPVGTHPYHTLSLKLLVATSQMHTIRDSAKTADSKMSHLDRPFVAGKALQLRHHHHHPIHTRPFINNQPASNSTSQLHFHSRHYPPSLAIR